MKSRKFYLTVSLTLALIILLTFVGCSSTMHMSGGEYDHLYYVNAYVEEIIDENRMKVRIDLDELGENSKKKFSDGEIILEHSYLSELVEQWDICEGDKVRFSYFPGEMNGNVLPIDGIDKIQTY